VECIHLDKHDFCFTKLKFQQKEKKECAGDVAKNVVTKACTAASGDASCISLLSSFSGLDPEARMPVLKLSSDVVVVWFF
jgi:hypothetical protein